MTYFKSLDSNPGFINLPPTNSAAANDAEKEKRVTGFVKNPKLVGRIALGTLALLTIIGGGVVAKALWLNQIPNPPKDSGQPDNNSLETLHLSNSLLANNTCPCIFENTVNGNLKDKKRLPELTKSELRKIDTSEFSKKDLCKASISPYSVNFEGDCDSNERREAYKEQKRLSDLREKELEKEAKRAAAEYSKKIQKKIDDLKAEKDKWASDWNERIRKIDNPTPEEEAALYAEIDCELDERFLDWLGYTPRCKKNEYEILGIPLSASKSDLKKQFRKLALLYHPDKNNSPDAKEKFLKIQNAYNTIFPDEKNKEVK